MDINAMSQKITTEHLKRAAYLYIRQSTIRQVFENTESTKRQYGLRERAIALGWPIDRVIIIDSDLGKSGADVDREGFQRLVAEVGLGNVGIVLGLEVSRLARNSMDWHRLLEICALSGTLILDEDGIYDPSHFNDRLLLGLKGTMSEAELHVIRARLQGGIANKARRGELKMRLPVGLVYDTHSQVQLDPDQQVQAAIRMLFSTFKRLNSACAVVKYFREHKLKFPRRPHKGSHKGLLLWGGLDHSRALQVLHNPRYAGAFVFGKTKMQKNIEGRSRSHKVDKDQWEVVIQNHHPGYLTWEEYEANLQQLKNNAHSYSSDRRKSTPKDGPALLQGIVICGQCGTRMTIRYGTFAGKLVPHYMCQRQGIEKGIPVCQHIPGSRIDEAIEKMLLETVTSVNLDITFAIENELKARLSEQDALQRQQVERAKYEADLSRRRYMQVDPDNRLVVNTLEAEWNEKLRAYQTAQDEYEKQHNETHHFLDDEQLNKIKQLANNFPKVWNNPATSNREKKRLTQLIIEDVTLSREEQIVMQIRFKGGSTKTINLPLPKPSWELNKTDQSVVQEIDRLLDDYTVSEIVKKLNEKGFHSGWGKEFHQRIVARLCKSYTIKSRYDRLREQGLLTAEEIAVMFNIALSTVKIWRRRKLLRYHRYNDKGGYLYERPGPDAPIKNKWKSINKQQNNKVLTDRAMEVQCAA